MSKFLVVIPAHNEEETIREVVGRALHYADVSVTDDGSRDGTARILAEMLGECEKGLYANRLNVITHPQATHIPQGIQDGMKYAVAAHYDYVITMDAGLSHNPDALADFMACDPAIDLVIGSRGKVENVPAYRRVISLLAAKVVNYALTPSYFDFRGKGLRDCTSGFRRYSKKAFTLVAGRVLESKAFDFHMEALVLCVRSSMTVSEMPINYLFSNSSFNKKVLKQAIRFGLHIIATKAG